MSGRPPLPVQPTDQDWHVHQHERGHWQIVQTNGGGSTRLNFGDDEARCRGKFEEMLAHGPCVECGGVRYVDFVATMKARLLESGLCSTCDHWTMLHAKREDPRVAVIEGQHYMIERDLSPRTPRHCAGFGGSKHTIRFNDGREVVTHNLWAQGTIPDHFRERLPDTAIFVR